MTLYDEVRVFVAEQAGTTVDSLMPETGLLTDLRLDPPSLESFLRAYADRFGVDVAAFRTSHHFAAQQFDPLSPMMLMLFRLLSSGTAQKLADAEPRDITLYHLATCAERKVWAPPQPRRDVPWSAATHAFDLIQAFISLGVFVIVLFCVFVGATLVGFALAQWPRFAMDPLTVLAGPLFLIFGIGYPLWSFRNTRTWIGHRLAVSALSDDAKKKAPEREAAGATLQ